MNKRCFLIFVIALGVMIVGCSHENSPTSSVDPTIFDSKQAEPLPPSPLADDTLGSDIATAIAAVGDSITYGDGSAVGGYPVLLQNLFIEQGLNVVVHNEGIPGEEAYQTNSRFRQATRGMDFVLLMIGTNDLWTIGTPFDTHPISNIEQMLDRALSAGLIPLISTIIPQSHCARDYNPLIEQLNQQIYAAAAERGIRVVDNYSAMLENGGDILYSDCLHPNDSGYEVIAQQFFNAILEYPLIRTH